METASALISAVGCIASPLNVDRQKAGMGILDRAGEATATKQVVQQTGEDERTHKFDLSDVPTELLELFAGIGQGDGPGPGEGREGGTE